MEEQKKEGQGYLRASLALFRHSTSTAVKLDGVPHLPTAAIVPMTHATLISAPSLPINFLFVCFLPWSNHPKNSLDLHNKQQARDMPTLLMAVHSVSPSISALTTHKMYPIQFLLAYPVSRPDLSLFRLGNNSKLTFTTRVRSVHIDRG
jgi:hypothetical protein